MRTGGFGFFRPIRIIRDKTMVLPLPFNEKEARLP
jgi:hypothetical protein